MSRLSAVIGASYGDEGKGHAVDYLAKPNSLIVRFNGGAQAGHTVTTPEGRRHVFHHFGSGTFVGARTFLSSFFIANPILFVEELKALKKDRPTVIVDVHCPISTPYDMMLNQAAEGVRGDKKHGSCGLGINETMVRSQGRHLIQYKDLFDESRLRKRLLEIRKEWAPARAKALGVGPDLPLFMSDGLMEHYLEDVRTFLANTVPSQWGDRFIKMANWDSIVFEGAQGLRLDQDNKEDFPYVTHSHTGLRNIMALLDWADISGDALTGERLSVYYVTRPYITRHGAGPLEHEVPLKTLNEQEGMRIVDETNVHNIHQGTLRFARMDLAHTVRTINKDILENRGTRSVQSHIFMTCADHGIGYVHLDGKMEYLGGPALAEKLSQLTGSGQYFIATGPGRDAVKMQ